MRDLAEHVVELARRMPLLELARRRVRDDAAVGDDDRAGAHGVDFLENMR